MKWGKGDLGVELYLATERFIDRRQYDDSQQILKFIEENGPKDLIEINYLDSLDRHLGYFNIVKDPTKEVKLPFLVCAYTCQTSALLGFSGLEDVLKELEGPMFMQYRQNKHK